MPNVLSVDINDYNDEQAEVIIRATSDDAAAEAKEVMDLVNMDVSFEP